MARLGRDPHSLIVGATGGDRASLARLLTLCESPGPRHDEVVAWAYAAPAPWVVGLTGAPGAGKSTLTNALVRLALDESPDRWGVVCVDPTSPRSGGALLGDRARLDDLTLEERCFVRSLASRGALGGLARAVPDDLRVLGAAGYPTVVLETVGVGQLEVDVADEADTTVVVVTPGWGDEIQASKAGLMEIADVFVINKSDRDGVPATRRDLREALGDRASEVPILECVASRGEGVSALYDEVRRRRESGVTNPARVTTRADRDLRRVMADEIGARVLELAGGEAFRSARDAVARGDLDPYRAARQLLWTS